jgi:ferredoxin-type protein NapF
MVDLARRGFFRGQPRPKAEMRPPWAVDEDRFSTLCTRCGDCLRACPTGILVAGDGAFPTVDFQRGECTFCGDCRQACPSGALQAKAELTWPHKAHIDARCLAQQGVECRVCGDYCAARAIRFTPRLGGSPWPAVDTTACTGCGACVAACPTQAIAIRE